MSFLAKLERKYGKYAISQPMLYIIGLNAFGFIMYMMNPQMLTYICWDMEKILHGQIWRLVTFVMFPSSVSLLSFMLFALVYYMIGNTLERAWGKFRLNLYILIGILGHILAGVVVYYVFHINMMNMSTTYLNMSMFLALAMTFPDTQFYLYFLIPIKAKWMALIDLAFLVYEMAMSGWSVRVMIIISLLNFILFFFLTRDFSRYNPHEIHRRQEFKRKTKMAAGNREAGPAKAAGMHKCAVCGRTDRDFPDLEFRYCSKCVGAYEYCMEHLYTHQHITAPKQ